MQSYRFIIKGLVQGVYYRKTIYENAKKSNIQGYVKNLQNGDVEAVANLDSSNFDTFISILKKGSSISNVTNVLSSKINANHFKDFSIRYS
jgi:acylphosphatase